MTRQYDERHSYDDGHGEEPPPGCETPKMKKAVYIEETIHRQLKVAGANENRPVGIIVEGLLESYLKEGKKPPVNVTPSEDPGEDLEA
jgi:hypothetical protein